MENVVIKKRIEWMDFFKGIGIIIMIMGHIGYGKTFDYFIHAFHMPMFYIISGFFFSRFKNEKEICFKEFAIKKAKGLLIPYIFFGAFHSIVYIILNHGTKNKTLLINLIWINTDGVPIAGALWFLTSLFWVEIIYFFIDKFLKNQNIKYILIIAIALLGNLLPQFFRLPLALDTSFVGVGLFLIGNLLRDKENNKILNLNVITCVLVAGVIGCLIFCNGYVNMRNGIYSIIVLFWINAILSTILGMNFSKIMLKKNKSKLTDIIINIGKNSITYVCLNQLVISIIKRILMILPINNILLKLLMLPVTIITLYICDYIFNNSRLRIFIGRRLQ